MVATPWVKIALASNRLQLGQIDFLLQTVHER